MNGLERRIQFEAAFDRRDPSLGEKSEGIHGVDVRFTLKGPRGAVVFILYTNWQLPEIDGEFRKQVPPDEPHFLCRPMPADLVVHSPERMPTYQSIEDSCALLDGRRCFHRGSVVRSEDVYQRLLRHGDDGVWEALESEYRCVLENGGHRRECLCASMDAGLRRFRS